MDYSNPIVICANIIEFLMVYISAYIVLTPKLKLWQILSFCYAGFAAGYYLTGRVFLNTYFLRVVISYGFSMLPVVLLYKDKLHIKLLFIIGTLLLISVAEVLCVMMFPGLTTADYLDIYIVYLSEMFVVLFAGTWLFYRLYKQKKTAVSYKDRAVLLLMPFSQIAALTGWVKVVQYRDIIPDLLSDGIVSLIIVILLLIVSDALLVGTLKRSANAARLEAENAAFSAQIESQKKYYSMLNDQFTAIREIRHDISNHLYTISALVDRGKTSEASDYAEKYIQDVSAVSITRVCENASVNAFLHYKLLEFRQQGIDAGFDVKLADCRDISDVDLVTILGNLLDNAAEACAGLTDAVIKLRTTNENGFILISVENPCSGEPAPHKQRFAGLARGAGTTIINGLAEKYSGSYTYGEINGVYTAVVSLKSE